DEFVVSVDQVERRRRAIAFVLLPRSALRRAVTVALIGRGSEYAPPGPWTVAKDIPATGLPVGLAQDLAQDGCTAGIAFLHVLLKAALEADTHCNTHGNGHCNTACQNGQEKLGRNAKTHREQSNRRPVGGTGHFSCPGRF